jgi:hypothetical protein
VCLDDSVVPVALDLVLTTSDRNLELLVANETARKVLF